MSADEHSDVTGVEDSAPQAQPEGSDISEHANEHADKPAWVAGASRAADADADADAGEDATADADDADATVVLQPDDLEETAVIDPVDAEEHEADSEAREESLHKLYDEPAEETFVVDAHSGGRVVDATKPVHRRHLSKKALAIIAAVVVVLAAAYCGVALFFSSHFFPNTTVNGDDVSLVEGSELADRIRTFGEEYAFTVTGDGVDVESTGRDIGLSYDGEKYAQDALAQVNNWAWPYELTQAHTIEVERPITYDETLLAGVLAKPVGRVNDRSKAPTNAKVAFSSKKNEFVIVSEKIGTELSPAAVEETVGNGVRLLQEEIELGEAELKQPKIKSDDPRLAMGAEKANGFALTKVTLTVNKKKVYQVKPALVAKWVSFNDDFEAKLDESAVTAWAQGELSSKFDTVGARRVYKRKDGKKVTVSDGTYGWIIDGAALGEDLSEHLREGTSGKLEIKMLQSGNKWNPGGADWTRYIDIDLSEQHARMYNKKGKLIWQSDIVSGLPRNGRETPTGVYVINWKGRDQTLVGSDANGDGKPDYRSRVSYWMPFVDNAVALHDAPWRGAFGGSIYQSNGSHGCVNLPASKAAELYGIVEAGDVVSCHK